MATTFHQEKSKQNQSTSMAMGCLRRSIKPVSEDLLVTRSRHKRIALKAALAVAAVDGLIFRATALAAIQCLAQGATQ